MARVVEAMPIMEMSKGVETGFDNLGLGAMFSMPYHLWKPRVLIKRAVCDKGLIYGNLKRYYTLFGLYKRFWSCQASGYLADKQHIKLKACALPD